ncbi:MAG: hypothetical protein V9F01_07025 [Chitinophagaceae bacterium]
MAILKVKRKSEWINRVRNIGIYLDGVRLGTVSNGETAEFEIAEGAHQLKAKIDWCRSNEESFTVSAGETYSIIVSAFKYANVIIGAELFFLFTHIILKNTQGIGYIIWFAVPFFLCNVYYATIGYNKYLLIKEDNLSLSF